MDKTTTRKRKTPSTTADALSRVANISSSSSDSIVAVSVAGNAKDSKQAAPQLLLKGRGSQSGWTSCPLCGKYSKKKYSIGRGIASHLQAIHTPWKPSKLALKIKRRQMEQESRDRERIKQQQQHQRNSRFQEETTTNDDNGGNGGISNDHPRKVEAWEPTQQEIDDWNKRVLEIITKIETQEAASFARQGGDHDNCQQQTMGASSVAKNSTSQMVDRIGRPTKVYKESLPRFLEAASKGDMTTLQTMVDEVSNDNQKLLKLLDTKDRHGSTADHWAAGGGHLDCLEYILKLRSKLNGTSDEPEQNTSGGSISDIQNNNTKQKVRRRDGKTCLHYAARNGHIECVRYLIKEAKFLVDEVSGEGSTPLHLACYGGHPNVVRYLVEECGADPCVANEWGCTAAHWVGMTISLSEHGIRELCNYLQQTGVKFVDSQSQGHTALHKAAHRRNKHVIKWLADDNIKNKSSGSGSTSKGAELSKMDIERIGREDSGGHKPSAIWRAVGGESEFAAWMESLGW